MRKSREYSARSFKRPNMFFIGGMRCGSTTINMLLEQHPDIYMSPVKEPYFYSAEAMRRIADPDDSVLVSLHKFENGGKHRTFESYMDLFSGARSEKIIGESSHYLYRNDVAETIKTDCPEARILVVLRDPIERLHSEYLFLRRKMIEGRSFSDFVRKFLVISNKRHEQIHVPKLNKGLQSELLRPWLKCFGRSQMKILLFDDLASDPKNVVSSTYSWLGVDPDFQPVLVHAQKGGVPKFPRFHDFIDSRSHTLKLIKRYAMPKLLKEKLREKIYSVTLERTIIDDETYKLLRDFYQADVLHLEKMINQKLPGWLENGNSISGY